MNYSLIDHNRGYQITSKDALFSMLTAFSGAPYAMRHHQLAKMENAPRWGHRLIGLAEFIPILGLLIALVERVVYALLGLGYSSVPWREKPLSIAEASKEMKVNALKAVDQHFTPKGVYPSIKKVADEIFGLGPKQETPLQFSHHVAEDQSRRPQMEDAHFYKEMEKGVLAGVFDGHGGKEVSNFASKQFQERFPKALENAKGNVHNAFENVIHHIHQDIVKHSSWNDKGSTAVVCYIDKETHQVYTATLGDSEANIYRKSLFGRVTSIPLSLVLDWKQEIERLIKVFGEDFVNAWMQFVGGNSKFIRSRLYQGVNVSRALGDVDQTGTPRFPLVIHEPEITVNKLHSKDKLILACDGLKDFVDEKGIASIVGKANAVSRSLLGGNSSPLADQLVQAALKNMTKRHNDNVTVLAIDVA